MVGSCSCAWCPEKTRTPLWTWGITIERCATCVPAGGDSNDSFKRSITFLGFCRQIFQSVIHHTAWSELFKGVENGDLTTAQVQ
eukprot:7766652-Pyramimonas_sp.AAC.1